MKIGEVAGANVQAGAGMQRGMLEPEELSRRIKGARKTLGLTQKQLDEGFAAANYDTTIPSRLERMEIKPTGLYASMLSEVLEGFPEAWFSEPDLAVVFRVDEEQTILERLDAIEQSLEAQSSTPPPKDAGDGDPSLREIGSQATREVPPEPEDDDEDRSEPQQG